MVVLLKLVEMAAKPVTTVQDDKCFNMCEVSNHWILLTRCLDNLQPCLWQWGHISHTVIISEP